MSFRSRLALPVLTALALAAMAASYAAAAPHAVPKPAVRNPLGSIDNPIGGKGKTLGLSLVTIPVGTALALHHHPGTDIAFIQAGIVTYSVKSGHVTVMSGPANGSPTVVRQIGPGQTGNLVKGDWIIEDPSVIHHALSTGKVAATVLIASLYPIGAPAAIPN